MGEHRTWALVRDLITKYLEDGDWRGTEILEDIKVGFSVDRSGFIRVDKDISMYRSDPSSEGYSMVYCILSVREFRNPSTCDLSRKCLI